jgi:NADH-quinone oxidoreductase subunit A
VPEPTAVGSTVVAGGYAADHTTEHVAAYMTHHAADHVTHDVTHHAADHVTHHAADYFQSYSVVGLLAVVGVLFVAVAFGAGRLLRPVVPTPEKLLTYECGVDPVGEGWAHTQVRYYVYAFLYVIFAVDSIFLFPWATVFAAPGYGATTLVEMFIFLGFLAVGLLYAYKKGVLAWT